MSTDQPGGPGDSADGGGLAGGLYLRLSPIQIEVQRPPSRMSTVIAAEASCRTESDPDQGIQAPLCEPSFNVPNVGSRATSTENLTFMAENVSHVTAAGPRSGGFRS